MNRLVAAPTFLSASDSGRAASRQQCRRSGEQCRQLGLQTNVSSWIAALTLTALLCLPVVAAQHASPLRAQAAGAVSHETHPLTSKPVAPTPKPPPASPLPTSLPPSTNDHGHAAETASDTRAHPADPALARSAALVGSTNVRVPLHANSTNLSEYDVLLNLARRQHQQKALTDATRNFAALLQGPAPAAHKRTALLELAVIAQEEGELAKAQQVFAQFLRTYPADPSVPEVLLRQGLIYRQMGAPDLALSKFYSVMTTALRLKEGSLDLYKQIVLQAQTEIADTYYLRGEHREAEDFLRRLLRLESANLNKQHIQVKLLRVLAGLGEPNALVTLGEEFLREFPDAHEEAEVRFLTAHHLLQLKRTPEALTHVRQLLKPGGPPDVLAARERAHWQQRAGNQIANQLYEEADYLSALEIYQLLGRLHTEPSWQCPVWYQIGLAYERLHQWDKAQERYAAILDRQKELASELTPGLKTVMDMAKWRHDFLGWRMQAERINSTNARPHAVSPLAATSP
jgi:tetratricopeptide (TPR) repeat protein